MKAWAAAGVWLGLFGFMGVRVWGAPVKVQQATLYVGAPAEVQAVVTADSSEASFDLPKGLVPDSLKASRGSAILPVSLQKTFGPRQGSTPPQLKGYRGKLSGASRGASVTISFRDSGLRWTPSAALRLGADRGKLEIQASIENDALDLVGARLRLMSGRPGGESGRASDGSDYDEMTWWYQQAMREMGQEVEAGGLHLVTELGGSGVPKGGSRQVPLLATEVSVARGYRWDTAPRREGEPALIERANAVYSFRNGSELALPEAMVAVSEGGTAIGKGRLAWTPTGGQALVEVASAEGLSVRRSEESQPDPKTWENRKSVQLSVTSARSEEVALRAIEHLRSPYDLGYEDEPPPVYEFSQQPKTMGDGGSFTWDLRVPAHGEASVSYSYREPVDLTPLRVLSFPADGSVKERQYLVEAPGSDIKGINGQYLRRTQPDGYIVYRLPVPAGVKRAEASVGLGNAFRVSLAPDVNGKPGAYQVVADATAIAGRVIKDGSNWNWWAFDLTPYLSATSRTVYLRIDNPEAAEAFTRGAEVCRIPEGLETRAPSYPVMGTVGGPAAPAPAPASPRRVLYSFDAYAPAEEAALYSDTHTERGSQERVLQRSGRVVYAFVIPSDVPAADCLIRVGNGFSIGVARDEGGQPGEYHEEVSTLSLLKRRVYGNENLLDYPVDLTPYLQNNPARTVYVQIYHADPADDFGIWLRHVEVAALDDAERSRFQRLERSIRAMQQEDKGHYLLNFMAVGDSTEAQFIYDTDGSEVRPGERFCTLDKYVVYRLPLTAKDVGAEILVTAWGDMMTVSLAPEVGGKPGEFREAARTTANPRFTITSAMAAAGACYVRITCVEKTATVRQISVYRP